MPDARDIVTGLANREVTVVIGASVYDPGDPLGAQLGTMLALVSDFQAALARGRTVEGMRMARVKGRRGDRDRLPSRRRRAAEPARPPVWRDRRPVRHALATYSKPAYCSSPCQIVFAYGICPIVRANPLSLCAEALPTTFGQVRRASGRLVSAENFMSMGGHFRTVGRWIAPGRLSHGEQREMCS